MKRRRSNSIRSLWFEHVEGKSLQKERTWTDNSYWTSERLADALTHAGIIDRTGPALMSFKTMVYPYYLTQETVEKAALLYKQHLDDERRKHLQSQWWFKVLIWIQTEIC